jgi:hypothetical protein
MATFTEVRDLILGDLHRNDLTTQVEAAMSNVVAQLQMERFYFNETQESFTATLTSDYAVGTVLPTLLSIDHIRVWQAGHPMALDRGHWIDANAEDETLGTGTPSHWAVHHQMLRLYPRPSQTMSIEVVGLKNLSASAWCSYAPTLMRAQSQVELYTLVLHDVQGAQRAAAYAQVEKERVQRRLATMATSGEVRPYL